MQLTGRWAWSQLQCYIVQGYISLPAVAYNTFKQKLVLGIALNGPQSVPPHVPLGPRPRPDHRLVPGAGLDVHVECADVGTKHVIPEGQAGSSLWRGLLETRGDHGLLTLSSWGRGLDVNVIACKTKTILISTQYKTQEAQDGPKSLT